MWHATAHQYVVMATFWHIDSHVSCLCYCYY